MGDQSDKSIEAQASRYDFHLRWEIPIIEAEK
jgi:hypothetical protein